MKRIEPTFKPKELMTTDKALLFVVLSADDAKTGSYNDCIQEILKNAEDYHGDSEWVIFKAVDRVKVSRKPVIQSKEPL